MGFVSVWSVERFYKMSKWHYPNSPYANYRRALEILETDYILKQKALLTELREAQKICLHEHSTYFPDASGNNDSWTECDECGKTL